MAELVFFYVTLMTPFNRTGRFRIDEHLAYKARDDRAALFDLGIYPAPCRRAMPRARRGVRDNHTSIVLGPSTKWRVTIPTSGSESHTRMMTPVTLDIGAVVDAWAYSTTRLSGAPSGSSQAIIWTSESALDAAFARGFGGLAAAAVRVPMRQQRVETRLSR